MACLTAVLPLGALGGRYVMGINPWAGAVMAAAVHITNVLGKAFIEDIKRDLKNGIALNLCKATIQILTFAVQGFLLYQCMKIYSVTLPLFHLFLFAQVCARFGSIISGLICNIESSEQPGTSS